MLASRKEDAMTGSAEFPLKLFFVFFLIILFFSFGSVAVFGNFLLLVFFVFIIIQVFGDDIQMDGMDLRHFQFGLALGATQNLALFDLIFIDVHLGGTFTAADHNPSSVRRQKAGASKSASTTIERII